MSDNEIRKGMTIWNYTPMDDIRQDYKKYPSHDRGEFLYSGTGTAEYDGPWGLYALFGQSINRVGHAITVPYDYDKPWNHHVIGVGHNDAEFCEARLSHASYKENDEPYGGKWWENQCLYCKQEIFTNDVGVNGSVDCPGNQEGHKPVNGRHVPSDRCTFRYYNPTRDMHFEYAIFHTNALREFLEVYREEADKALERHNWDVFKHMDQKCAWIANVLRWRQENSK